MPFADNKEKYKKKKLIRARKAGAVRSLSFGFLSAVRPGRLSEQTIPEASRQSRKYDAPYQKKSLANAIHALTRDIVYFSAPQALLHPENFT